MSKSRSESKSKNSEASALLFLLLLILFSINLMNMTKTYFDHEKLIAYQRSMQFVAWSSPLLEKLPHKLAVAVQQRARPGNELNAALVSDELFVIEIGLCHIHEIDRE